jgi:hypothetical protein
MTISQEKLDEVFALIEAAAAKGERCPQARPHGPIHPSRAPAVLARQGRLLLEIYALNWRVAVILEGRHKGKRTLPPPFKVNRPYKIIGKAPSAPRLLTKDELA